MIKAAILSLAALGLPVFGQVPGSSRLLLNAQGQSQAYTGIGRLTGAATCTAAFFKQLDGAVPDAAPAYVVTSGHCFSTSGTNDVTVGQATSRYTFTLGYFIDTQDAQVRFTSKSVAWASMKGTDLAIIELNNTHGELVRLGYRPLEISPVGLGSGETILAVGAPGTGIPSDEAFLRQTVCGASFPYQVIEFNWTFYNSFESDCSDIKPGSSGSPVLSFRTGKIAGVINTTTQDAANTGGGFDCYLGVPCEIHEKGPVVIRDAAYHANFVGMNQCFKPDGVFDVNLVGCPLDPGRQLALSGYPNRSVRPPVSWHTALKGDLTHYRYKTGPENSTDCRDPNGYGRVIALAESSVIDDPIPSADGGYYLCVQAGASPVVDGSWQEVEHASFRNVRIDTTPPILKPSIGIRDEEARYVIEFNFAPPELSSYEYKYGPRGSTDCAARQDYSIYRRVPVNVPKSEAPFKLCVIATDEAGNATPPVERVLGALSIFEDGVANAASYEAGRIAPGSIAAVFGSHFPENPTVTITDGTGTLRKATVYAATRSQINFLVPPGTPQGIAPVAVADSSGASDSQRVVFDRAAPGIFTAAATGSGPPAAYMVRIGKDGSRTRQLVFSCAGPLYCAPTPLDLGPESEYFLELYGTGIRGGRFVDAYISLYQVDVRYAGAQGGVEGLDQVNVRIPPDIPVRGYVNLLLMVDGRQSNPVTLRLR